MRQHLRQRPHAAQLMRPSPQPGQRVGNHHDSRPGSGLSFVLGYLFHGVWRRAISDLDLLCRRLQSEPSLLAAVPVRRIDATTITQLGQGLVELAAHLIGPGEGLFRGLDLAIDFRRLGLNPLDVDRPVKRRGGRRHAALQPRSAASAAWILIFKPRIRVALS